MRAAFAARSAVKTASAANDIPAGALVLDRWKANDLVGANASAVASWTATTGGVALAQGTSGNRPTLRTNVLNGKSVVRFDGTDDYLSGTLAAADSQPFTLYFLINATTLGNVARQILFSSFEVYLNALTTTTSTRAVWTASNERTFGTYTQGTWELWTIISDGTTASVYVNGTSAYSGTFGNATFGTSLVLGRHTTNGRYFNGDVAEIVHCDGLHDSTQRSGVHAYFAAEYGLTIAP